MIGRRVPNFATRGSRKTQRGHGRVRSSRNEGPAAGPVLPPGERIDR